MDNNEGGDAIVGLDLNQEPLEASDESVLGLGSLLDELETAHGQIEERIRQLEAATARARQRQRWRQARNPSETSNLVSERVDTTSGEGVVQNVELGVPSREGTVDRAEGCKRDSTYLVAKALELDMDAKKVVGDGGGFFDCNICLDMAREPILTCCGHLFCWACFYQLPYVYPTAKECPVCKGEVTDKNVTPIYGNGNGNNTHLSDLESGLKVPPRPQAHRIESVRQQRVNRGISHIPVAEALRRIRIGIGATWERPLRPNLESVSIGGESTNVPNRVQAPEASSNAQVGGGGQPRTHLFSRVLSESADSLLSISSALSNAERIVDDLESYLFQRIFGRSSPEQGLDDYVGSVDAAVRAQRQTVDSTTAVLDSATPLSSSSESMHVSASDVHLRNPRHDTATGIDLTELQPSSSSSRRRLRLSRLDAENGVSREPRRRRLN